MPGSVETAIAGVLAVYGGMSKAKGYSVDVKYATRHPQVLDSLTTDQIPAVSVARSPGAGGAMQYLGEETYKEKIRLEIFLFLRSDGRNPDQFGLATAGEAALSDLKAVQLKDPTFGTAEIRDSRLLDSGNFVTWDADIAIASLELEAVVIWNATAPP